MENGSLSSVEQFCQEQYNTYHQVYAMYKQYYYPSSTIPLHI